MPGLWPGDMAIKRCQGTISVVEAAKIRIRNAFHNGLAVYMSFSGGKDSLCLGHLVLELIQHGEVSAEQLIVQFIDEEAIFPCIESTVKEWRRKFLMVGAKFEWYCMEVRHFNCFNQLENDESFICWDSAKADCWVRQAPSFAIRSHPMLRQRIDTYQDFLGRYCVAGMTLVGVRTAESLQRLQNFANITVRGKDSCGRKKIYPIYDWKNSDVWRYLHENHVNIPDVYLYMWQAGLNKSQLRVSQFFSIDTARSLVKMNEYYPNLLDSIIKREPNAYLAALYWDTEMFGKNGKTRKELEGEMVKKDYRAELHKLFSNIERYFPGKHQREVAKRYRNFYLSAMQIIDDKELKHFYESLLGGDPKLRNLRAIYHRVYSKYNTAAKEECRNE